MATWLSRRDALKTSLLSAAAATIPSTAGGPFAFDHVNVLDRSGNLLTDQTVLVEGKRITSLDATGRMAHKGNAHVVNGTGKYLIPGLWDMHVHLSYTKKSALPILLANGVTGVRDCGGLLHEIDGWQAEVRVDALNGPQIVRAGPQVSGKVSAFTQIAVFNESEARGAVKALHIAGVDFIKVIAAISRDAYFGVAQQCKTLGFPFAGHIPRVLSPAECSDAGQASLEHIDSLFDGKIPEAATLSEKLSFIKRFRRDEAPALFAQFAQNRTHYTPTLIASAYPYLTRLAALGKSQVDARAKYVSRQSQTLTEKLFTKYKEELTPAKIEAERQPFQEYLELVGAMNAAGVPLLAGSDLATSVFYPGFSLHDELELLVKAGLTSSDAIATATQNPAALLGFADLGSIATGQIANLVLLDQSPLADIKNTTRINSVVYEGKLFDRAALNVLLRIGAEMAARS